MTAACSHEGTDGRRSAHRACGSAVPSTSASRRSAIGELRRDTRSARLFRRHGNCAQHRGYDEAPRTVVGRQVMSQLHT